MKRKIGIVIVCTLIILFLYNVVSEKIASQTGLTEASRGFEQNLAQENSVLKKDQLAPDVTFTTLDGKSAQLSDYIGQNVVLNFWATWCPPCKAEMPAFQHYYEQYGEAHNVVILGFNMTFSKDSKEKVEQFIEEYEITFPIYLTEDKNVLKTYQIASMPTTIFIDTEGRVQRKIIGPVNEQALIEYVEQLNE